MQYKRLFIFINIGTALLILTYQLGDTIVHAMIPMYQWAIKFIDYRFDVTMLSISKNQGENFLQLDVVLSQPFWLGAQQIAPSQPLYNSAGMPLGYALQPLVIILTMILAWPTKQAITFIYRLLISIPLILLIMLLDMPIQLINSIWQGFEKMLQLDIATTNWFGFWSDFLNGGGLIALSIACGLMTIGLAQWRPRHESNV
jgi:hypothetical protein